jgi:hypothetical protein
MILDAFEINAWNNDKMAPYSYTKVGVNCTADLLQVSFLQGHHLGIWMYKIFQCEITQVWKQDDNC